MLETYYVPIERRAYTSTLSMIDIYWPLWNHILNLDKEITMFIRKQKTRTTKGKHEENLEVQHHKQKAGS